MFSNLARQDHINIDDELQYGDKEYFPASRNHRSSNFNMFDEPKPINIFEGDQTDEESRLRSSSMDMAHQPHFTFRQTMPGASAYGSAPRFIEHERLLES